MKRLEVEELGEGEDWALAKTTARLAAQQEEEETPAPETSNKGKTCRNLHDRIVFISCPEDEQGSPVMS